MTDDVVAELDAWLGAWEGPDDYRLTVQRARDEIVALRRRCVLHDYLALTEARDEALEAAARICQLSAQIMQPDEARLSDAIAAVKSCAAAIRKLKEEH